MIRSPIYNIALLFLSIYVLTALILEAFLIENVEIRRVLQYIDFFVCVIFLADFIACFAKAESKMKYMKWGWIDLVSSIPAIDPLRWGRVSRIVRILRYLRAIKSAKVILQSLHASKFETLTVSVFLVVFITYTVSAAIILEFEKGLESGISTAEQALWWAFLNLMNAKASISQALSSEGVAMTIVLNKVGLLLFAYGNSMIVAWLVLQKKSSATVSSDDGEN